MTMAVSSPARTDVLKSFTGGSDGEQPLNLVEGRQALETTLTFTHLDGYDWSTRSVVSYCNPVDTYEAAAFWWESTGYAFGGDGSIYGLELDCSVPEQILINSRIVAISETDMANVTESTCSALTYTDVYSRIADGEIVCIKRIPQDDYAAVQLVSHTDGPGYALDATLLIKHFVTDSVEPPKSLLE